MKTAIFLTLLLVALTCCEKDEGEDFGAPTTEMGDATEEQKIEEKEDHNPVKEGKAAGHYDYPYYHWDDDSDSSESYEDDYGYWGDDWDNYGDYFGRRGYGRGHHGRRGHGRGRSSSSSSSSSIRSSSSSSSSSSSESSESRDHGHGSDSQSDESSQHHHHCPPHHPHPKSCREVKIGTEFDGQLQATFGPVASGGSVEIKCSGGLILSDDNGPTNSSIKMTCRHGRYHPNVSYEKLKELHCVTPVKCIPLSKLFLPIEMKASSGNVYQLILPPTASQPSSPGFSAVVVCNKTISSPNIPEYLVYFFATRKYILEDPGTNLPSLNFTCNAQGEWETLTPSGKKFVNAVGTTPYNTIKGIVTHGGVSCGNYA